MAPRTAAPSTSVFSSPQTLPIPTSCSATAGPGTTNCGRKAKKNIAVFTFKASTRAPSRTALRAPSADAAAASAPGALASNVNAFKAYYQHLVDDEFDKAEVTRIFYEEYMAVADLAADFYIETAGKVFQQHALPRGELTFRDPKVNPAAIRRTALLTVEGERDDICATGQTLAAQDLASSLRPYMRTHYVQPNRKYFTAEGRSLRSCTESRSDRSFLIGRELLLLRALRARPTLTLTLTPTLSRKRERE